MSWYNLSAREKPFELGHLSPIHYETEKRRVWRVLPPPTSPQRADALVMPTNRKLARETTLVEKEEERVSLPHHPPPKRGNYLESREIKPRQMEKTKRKGDDH
jgi:hypothetical protein